MPLARNSATAGDTLNGLAGHFSTHARRANKLLFSFSAATTASARVSERARTVPMTYNQYFAK